MGIQLKRPIDECCTRKCITVYYLIITEHINALCGQNAGSFSVKLQFAIMYVFKGNQSNQRLVALQRTHRRFRSSDGVFTCFIDD
jgi:hypothetical protein